jgi:hypothetical protein
MPILGRADVQIGGHGIQGGRKLGISVIAVDSLNLDRFRADLTVLLQKGFFEKKGLKLGRTAYIAIRWRWLRSRRRALGEVGFEILQTGMASVARVIRRCNSGDSAFGNDTTEKVKMRDERRSGRTYPLRSAAPTDSAWDRLRELLLDDSRL